LSVNPHRANCQEVDGHRSTSLFLLPQSAASSSEASAIAPFWLTDDLLFSFQRCHRRAYLDVFGYNSSQDPPSDYLLKLRQDSFAHQLEVLSHQPSAQPTYLQGDWQKGAEATLKLMQQGVERIGRGVLLHSSAGVQLVSCPDLLIRQPGNSIWGNWLYVPAEIRLGKRPKLDYQIKAAFHAYVLAAVQGAWPETSWLMLRQRGVYAVDLVELLPKMQVVLDDCIETLVARQEPEVFITHSRCNLCHWFSHCYEVAQSQQHLSLLPGVTPSRYTHLKLLNLTSVESLAAASVKQLEHLPGFGSAVAHKLIQQAQATLQNRAIAISHTPASQHPLLTEMELPTASVELYFDIEAAPEYNVIYLHGVLVVDRRNATETFHPLLAKSPEDEHVVWQQFLDLVWTYPEAPIFHFCPYEAQTIKRLGELYRTPYQRIEPLFNRMVDLHERVTRVVTLPVESYALKPIAKWLGFNWRNPEANGAQSIYWYSQWMQTGDRSYLEDILQYNEDDCRATYQVKDWLAHFVRIHLDAAV